MAKRLVRTLRTINEDLDGIKGAAATEKMAKKRGSSAKSLG